MARLPCPNGILTLCDAPFQETWTRRTHRKRLLNLQFGAPNGTQIPNLSSSRFTRRY
jgi:hypothetical protein